MYANDSPRKFGKFVPLRIFTICESTLRGFRVVNFDFEELEKKRGN